jgi:hypothetical protein
MQRDEGDERDGLNFAETPRPGDPLHAPARR